MGTENEHEHEDTVDGIPAVRRWPWPAQPPTSTEPPKPPRNYRRLRTAGMIGLWLVVFVGVGFLGDLASNNAPVTAFRHLIEPKASVEVQSKCSSCSKPHRSASVIATQPAYITGVHPTTAPIPTPTRQPSRPSPTRTPTSSPPSSSPPPTCTPPATGTPPDCATPPATCPPPETGTPPACATPPPSTCPPPTVGTPPVCATPSPDTGPSATPPATPSSPPPPATTAPTPTPTP
jgi:hypothetical protein